MSKNKKNEKQIKKIIEKIFEEEEAGEYGRATAMEQLKDLAICQARKIDECYAPSHIRRLLDALNSDEREKVLKYVDSINLVGGIIIEK